MLGRRKEPITGRRPQRLATSNAAIKPQKARQIIRAHHVLLKRKSQLETLARKNPTDATIIDQLKQVNEQITRAGGLERYQLASISGQNEARGGDSSKLLVKWLDELNLQDRSQSLLEIGSLSVNNACSRSRYFGRIERIDLNAQSPGIIKQDFMQRPSPRLGVDNDMFSVLSLSLVLNYVPDARTRGAMLLKTREYLAIGSLLFVVLPAPCVDNSRYLTETRYLDLMRSIGYTMVERKSATKVIYWLFRLDSLPKTVPRFAKTLVNDGKVRNNFSIIL